jgi:hypothetical protein
LFILPKSSFERDKFAITKDGGDFTDLQTAYVLGFLGYYDYCEKLMLPHVGNIVAS